MNAPMTAIGQPVVYGALVLILSVSVRAQDGAAADTESVRAQRWRAWSADRIATAGALRASVSREGRRIAATDVSRRVPFQAQSTPQQPKQGWIRRHPKLFGALVGFGVGCPIGAAQVGGSQDDFFNALDEWACPVLGGVGAAVGAGIGAALSR